MVKRSKRDASFTTRLIAIVWIVLGAFFAAFSIKVFFIPNNLIDGGVVGLAMIGSHLFNKSLLPYLLILFNLPFVFLAYKHIGKTLVVRMIIAIFLFCIFLVTSEYLPMDWAYWADNEPLEFIFTGGVVLGLGLGLIIKNGGCSDGTEIFAIILNKRMGFTVGQVILTINILIFALAGIAYQDWHTAIQSMLTYIVATKIMDIVIVGFDETKSVKVISAHSKKIADVLIHEYGIGLTVMYGRGGFSKENSEILYIIAERLQLNEIKNAVHREDPYAFIAVENIHEVINGRVSNMKR
ncbi:YitT family protein [Simkania negevensis]|uniref:YitT family protein n=1 Tax=Simkania negevensis TaxID=83561 RepID=A0ABS3ATX6_9BACT|nr:YitT family protein [Simkania negevensis]